MFPIVEPRQRPERFLLNRFSPLAESAAFLGLGGFDAAGSVWYPDARRLLGGVPNDGTLVNMDPATDWVWVPELGRWATDFDGSNDLVGGDNSASLGVTIACTVAAHVWFDAITATVNQGPSIFSKFSATAGKRSYQMYVYEDGSKLAFIFSTSGNYEAGNNVVSTVGASTGRWQHVAVTYNAGTLNFFLDGVLKQTVTGKGTAIYAGSSRWAIASQAEDNSRYLDGRIADPVVWSRALSPAEIATLANPTNFMLEVGGVPGLLPPHRVTFPAAVAEPVLTYRNYILGGGVI